MSSEPEKPNPEETPSPAPAIKQPDIYTIVAQLEDLVRFSMECEEKELKPDVSFVEVHKKLMQIQRDIQAFQENSRIFLQQFNLKPEDFRPTPEQIEQLNPRDRKLLERIQSLQNTCQVERDKLYESMQASPETLKQVKNELKDKGKEKFRRKSKFKGMGGKEGWLPT